MPGGDRTGPMGYGSRTGRGMGYCSGYSVPGYATPGFGCGFGRGRGWGRGWRWQAPYPYVPAVAPAPQFPVTAPTPENEMEYLEAAAKNLEEEMKSIKARIESLTSQK
ncbi:MAG: DUF5320 domain-containing protein [Methanotrichaceae archaeon]